MTGIEAPVAEGKLNLSPVFYEPRELVVVGVDRDSEDRGLP
jgi:hypothetical protein